MKDPIKKEVFIVACPLELKKWISKVIVSHSLLIIQSVLTKETKKFIDTMTKREKFIRRLFNSSKLARTHIICTLYHYHNM